MAHQNNLKIAFYNKEGDAVRHMENMHVNILTHFCMHTRRLSFFIQSYFSLAIFLPLDFI